MKKQEPPVAAVKGFKAKLNVFFSLMRKDGFVAKQNYQCCQSCGWTAIADAYPTATNIIFYHKQDTEDIYSHLQMYLAWRGDAKTIIKNAEIAKLDVNWNGSNEERILLQPRQ